MTVLRGSYYDTVGRVSMHISQKPRADGNIAINRNFDQSLFQQHIPPSNRVFWKIYPPFFEQHRNFPESDC